MYATTGTIVQENNNIQTRGCLEEIWQKDIKSKTIFVRYKTEKEKESFKVITKLMRMMYGQKSIKISRALNHVIYNSKSKSSKLTNKSNVIQTVNTIGVRGPRENISDILKFEFKKPEDRVKGIIYQDRGNSRMINGENKWDDNDFVNKVIPTKITLADHKKISITTESGRYTSIIVQFYRFINMDEYTNRVVRTGYSTASSNIIADIIKLTKKHGYNYQTLLKIFNTDNYKKIHGYWKLGSCRLGEKVAYPRTKNLFKLYSRTKTSERRLVGGGGIYSSINEMQYEGNLDYYNGIYKGNSERAERLKELNIKKDYKTL